MKTVSDYMTKKLVVTESNMLIVDAIACMRERNIGSVFVTNEHTNEIIGIFTERDLLRKIDLNNPQSLKVLTVRDIMTTTIKKIDAKETFVTAAEMMKESGIRHLAVTNNGIIVGIVSIRDLI